MHNTCMEDEKLKQGTIENRMILTEQHYDNDGKRERIHGKGKEREINGLLTIGETERERERKEQRLRV